MGNGSTFRHLVGHVASEAQVEAFIPDYRLAPEHPFPAAIDDAQACYRELVERGTRLVALTGDSAGGGLALVLLSITKTSAAFDGVIPISAVVLSPVTDLTLGGESWESRATSDPYFTQTRVGGLVKAYLASTAATDPIASPLFGSLAGLPPVRVHVGDDEVLLDVWEGMPHGFLGEISNFSASAQSVEAIGKFLVERFTKVRA